MVEVLSATKVQYYVSLGNVVFPHLRHNVKVSTHSDKRPSIQKKSTTSEVKDSPKANNLIQIEPATQLITMGQSPTLLRPVSLENKLTQLCLP